MSRSGQVDQSGQVDKPPFITGKHHFIACMYAYCDSPTQTVHTSPHLDVAVSSRSLRQVELQGGIQRMINLRQKELLNAGPVNSVLIISEVSSSQGF